MKWSRYNIYIPDNGSHKLLVFNTLARSLIFLNLDSEQEFDCQRSPEQYGEPDVLEKLRRLGVIVDDNIDERLLLKTTFNRERYDKTKLALFISFSSACNFACNYCYESYKDIKIKNRVLNEPAWEKIFLFIKERVSRDSLKTLDVTIFGGEPLVDYKVVLRAAQDLKGLSSLNVNVSAGLITNGSLLNNDRAKELKKYIDWVQFTIDGLPPDHNIRRPYKSGKESFTDVFNNLIVSIGVMKNIFLRINVDYDNYKRIPEFLDFLKNKGLVEGLGGIGFSWIFPNQMEIENANSPIRTPSVDEEKESILLNLQRKAVDLGFKISKTFIDGPCPFVSLNAFTVDEALKVYKCPGFLYQKPVGLIDEQGVLSINDNFWYEGVTLDPDCAYDCIYGPICFGGCHWQAGGLDRTSCKKDVHERLLKERIKIYADSLVRAKNA